MRKTVLTFIIILTNITFAIGQVSYAISIDDRNAAIELTKDAISDINNKDFTKAFLKLKKSIEIDSLFREAYLRIYQLYSLNKENTKESIEILEKGKRIYEEDDELFFYCGEIYRLNAMMDKAFYEYSKAIDYAKTNGEDFYLVPYYYLNRGNLYLASEKFDLAINDYNYLLILDSTSTGGLTNRGIAYYKIGEKEKACQDWDMAIKNGFEKANYYYQKHCKN
jgi:tetratricopeptide (TPR) repeat protein